MKHALTLLALGAACVVTDRAGAQGDVPASGAALVTRMHDAYAGKWYRTLTFVQKTTQRLPDGTERVSTWYEALRSPDRLRIDVGDPAQGNGVLYTADSAYRVRNGAVVSRMADGNPFLPFVAGIWTQPMNSTLRQIAPMRIDLARVRTDTWEGRPVYVVGARDAQDLDSPQFWVDAERLVPVRMLVQLIPNGKAKVQDIHLDDYVPVGGGWLATKVAMLDAGVPLQTEEYSDWHGDVTLPADFFVAERWGAVGHWKR
jgi:hypothetical protein